MPVMDGYEATRMIRADTRRKDIPIIAMTAHAMKSEQDRCLAVGMNDHVTKPVAPDRLYAVLASWVSRPTRMTTAKEGKKKTATDKPAAEGAHETLPDHIAGIDMAEARKMLRGNDVLLRRLLGDFHAGYMDQANTITAFLAAGDLQAAKRTAHTLKGVSGNIRAGHVYRAVKALDDQLRIDPEAPEVEVHLSELTRALNEVSGALANVLAADADGADPRAQAGDRG